VAALKRQACAEKLTFGLLTDLVTGFPSASGFVLLLQISIFALPVIQGFPGDPLVAFAWSMPDAFSIRLQSYQLLPARMVSKTSGPGVDREWN